MKVTALGISDVLLIEPKVFGDERGFFFESFNQLAFNEATGLDVHFVQDNHSRSARNVLRGLHHQLAPKAQGKLMGNGLARFFLQKTSGRCGYHRVLPTDFLCSANTRIFFTRRLIIMRRNSNAAFSGMTRTWPSPGH